MAKYKQVNLRCDSKPVAKRSSDEAYVLGVEHAERAAVDAVMEYHQRGRISRQASDGLIDAIKVGITRAGLRAKAAA